MGREDIQGSMHSSWQHGGQGKTPLKKRGLCLQANASRHPCRECEECIWVDQVPMDKGYADIVSIHAASGRKDAGGVEVKLDITARRANWCRYRFWDAENGCDEAPIEEMSVNIEPAALAGFMEGLEECGLLYWGERYELDEGMGTEWVIRIEFDGLRVKKSGLNSYPRRWETLCRLFLDYWQVEFR